MATYTTTQAPLPWMEPYLQNYVGRAQDVANVPYEQSPGTYAPPNALLTGGWQAAANRAVQGSPVMSAANQQLQNTIQGGFLTNSNPYLNTMVDQASQDVMRNMAPVEARSGSFGNSGVQQTMARALGDVSSQIRGNAYNTERGYMQQALGMAPAYANQDWTDIGNLQQAGAQMQGFQNAAQGQNQRWWEEAQAYPQQRLAAFGNALGVNAGGSTTQQQPDPSRASQAIGGGLTGLAFWNAIFGGK